MTPEDKERDVFEEVFALLTPELLHDPRATGEFETAFFTVSDIGLHARAYRDTLYVHAASLHDGAPLKGVELRVLDAGGEAVLKAATDIIR